MKYRFVLGIGRSGTTLLGKLIALTNSKLRYVIEPLPRLTTLPTNNYNEPWTVLPRPDSDEVNSLRETIVKLSKTSEIIRPDLLKETVERDDPAFDFLLIKEVHGLLAFPFALDTLDYKAVVITRDVTRIIDSTLHNHPHVRYLIDEYQFIKNYMTDKHPAKIQILDEALESTSPRLRSYIKKNDFQYDKVSGYTCINTIISNFLRCWANRQSVQVKHVDFETLGSSPVNEMQKIFSFLDLSFDDSILQKVYAMTHGGTEVGAYDTNKDSKKILKQSYKCLTSSDLDNIHNLIRSGSINNTNIISKWTKLFTKHK